VPVQSVRSPRRPEHHEGRQVDAETAQGRRAVLVVEGGAARGQQFVLLARHDHNLQPDLVHVGLVFLRLGDGDDVGEATVAVDVQPLVHQVDTAGDEGLQLGEVLQLGRIVGQQRLEVIELAVQLALGRAQRAQIGVGTGEVIAAQAAFRIGHEQVQVLQLARHAVCLRLACVGCLQAVQVADEADTVEDQDQDTNDTQQRLVQRKAANRPESGVGGEKHPLSFPFAAWPVRVIIDREKLPWSSIRRAAEKM